MWRCALTRQGQVPPVGRNQRCDDAGRHLLRQQGLRSRQGQRLLYYGYPQGRTPTRAAAQGHVRDHQDPSQLVRLRQVYKGRARRDCARRPVPLPRDVLRRQVLNHRAAVTANETCNVAPHGAATKVYAISQASATCAAAPCSSATPGDIAACCRDKAKCLTIRSTAQSESPSPFCGYGKIYNVAKDDESCALDTCAAHDVANNDVGTCCIDRAKCLTIKAAAQDDANNAFDCGSNKIYDTSKDDELCASSTCTSAGGANDIGTCCVAQGSGSAPGSLLARVPAAPSARRATGGSG